MIEAEHQQIVASVLSGTMDSADARMQVAALVVESGAAAKVAYEKSNSLTEQEIADISVILNDILVDKIIDPESYDFTKASTGTLLGWAMTYARKSKDSRLMNLRQRDTSRYIPFSHYDILIDGSGAEAFGSGIEARISDTDNWSTQSTEFTTDDEVFALALELLGENTKGLRETGRLFVESAILCLSYRLPMALRAINFADRQYVRDVLISDPSAAHWSLHDWCEIAALEASPEESSFDPRVLAIWDNFDIEEAHLLLSLPSEVPHTLALAAVSPKPKPGRRNLDKFRTAVKKMSATKGWNAIALRIVDSFIASEYEVFSEFNSKELDALALRNHERAISDFPDLLVASANFPGHPLGVTPSAIHASLIKTANTMLGNAYAIKGVSPS